MSLHHGRGHLDHLHLDNAVQLQDRANPDNTAAAVQVVYVTLPQTFSGSAVMVTQTAPAAAPSAAPATTAATTANNDNATSAAPTNTAASSTKTLSKTSAPPTTTASTVAPTTSAPDASSAPAPSTSASTSSVASAPTNLSDDALTTAPSTAVAVPAGAATSSASPSATSATHSGGISGGAAAGLALGLFLGLGALAAVILVLYRRKKRMHNPPPPDNEKAADPRNLPTPPPERDLTSSNTPRPRSMAPRLSLRPVTQFSPALSDNRKSTSNAMQVAHAATAPEPLEPSPPASPWERVGAAGANASVPTTPRFADNPFGDPRNPFGSDAGSTHSATPSILIPGTPPSAKSLSRDFAIAVPAAAAADGHASPTRKESPTGNKSPARQQSPVSSTASLAAPASPPHATAIPASPGPAPAGPPPVAGAGRPASPPDPNNVHRVQLEFKPTMNDELEAHAGDLIRLVHEYDDGWALCTRLNRSQQGVVPRTCLSKHPVKPRTGPPRGIPAGSPRLRGSPSNGPGAPQSSVNSNGRTSPPSQDSGAGPSVPSGSPRQRSNSSAPHPSSPPRSGSPGPYCNGHAKPRTDGGRRRSHSASNVIARRASPPGPSPMNPLANAHGATPAPKPLPTQEADQSDMPGMAM